ncbi:MAG: stage II sporulation protein M [Candidatus Nanoarchaeia archaeon]
MRAEKRKEEKVKNYLEQLLKTNSQIFLFFIWAFLGFTLAVATWYVVLPQNITRLLFEAQLTTIREINAVITGGLAAKSFFYAILTNNFKVLIFTLLFAFIFGPGVLFILTWNASVIGVAIGERIKFSILANPMVTGGSAVAHYTNIVSFGLVRYLIHGSLEVLAYFISAIAGMMLSLAVLETKQNTYLFKKTLCDVILLICFASIILILAGIIEVGINALFV